MPMESIVVAICVVATFATFAAVLAFGAATSGK